RLAAWSATSATATPSASLDCPWKRTEDGRRKQCSGTASVPIVIVLPRSRSGSATCTTSGMALAPPPVRRVPAGQELRDLLSEYDANARRMVSGGGWADVVCWVDQRA